MAPQRSSPISSSPSAGLAGPVAHRRIVVKAGTSLLTRGAERLNLEMMATLVEQIALLHMQGTEMLLVSSGAVAAGRRALGSSKDGKDVPQRQALAAVGQSRLMHSYGQLFDGHDITVAQALLSRRDLNDRLSYLNIRNTLLTLIERRVVPIINENDVVAVEELAGDAFGDNDALSAMVANLIDADLLVLLGEVEGLFTADPGLDPSARLIPEVERISENVEALGGATMSEEGRGGMATKLEAARLATASGVSVVIASGMERDVLHRLAAGDRIGTRFPATTSKMDSRKRWMLSRGSRRGEIVVDEGAVAALRDHHKSLLPAGMTDVVGTFERGDIISILDSGKGQVACGITNYGSEDLAKVKGARSDRIAEILGHQYGEEVVHRNNLVIL